MAKLVLPSASPAADTTKKDGHVHNELSPILTKKYFDPRKRGDTFVMACAKCKTVWTTREKEGVKGSHILNEHRIPTELIGNHACKGCDSRLEVTGRVNGGDMMEFKRVCKACGDDSAFCRATKRASGPAPGMEKKEQLASTNDAVGGLSSRTAQFGVMATGWGEHPIAPARSPTYAARALKNRRRFQNGKLTSS